jgi:hypothetical protein
MERRSKLRKFKIGALSPLALILLSYTGTTLQAASETLRLVARITRSDRVRPIKHLLAGDCRPRKNGDVLCQDCG